MKRITSIDALRAVTLWGILVVHTAGLFGFNNPNNEFLYFSDLDTSLIWITQALLSKRCAAIFSILFGVSFYLILKNPQNTSSKFLWRCFLLTLIGLFNKLFYTYDALMWYGLCGMMLVAFRNFSVRKLQISFVVMFFITLAVSLLDLGTVIFGGDSYLRYDIHVTFGDIVSYPLLLSVADYLRTVFDGGVFKTLSYFVLGYLFGRLGIIERLEQILTVRRLFVLFFSYFISFVVFYLLKLHTLFPIAMLLGALFYAALFIYIYNKYSSALHCFEAYGKLGLTNYSFQGIAGIFFISHWAIPLGWSFIHILAFSMLIYFGQLLFSLVWLKYFRYGPLEWIWRCLTNFKYQPLIINNENGKK